MPHVRFAVTWESRRSSSVMWGGSLQRSTLRHTPLLVTTRVWLVTACHAHSHASITSDSDVQLCPNRATLSTAADSRPNGTSVD